MTPAKFELIERWRRMVADQKDVLKAWEGGGLRLRSNGEDVTDDALRQMREHIARLEALIQRVEATDE